jgi:ABC-2 type transport system permease protein
MKKYHPLLELILARAREFYREPEAIFWVYVFPIILALTLGIAFREKPPDPVRVAVVEGGSPGSSGALAPPEAARRLESDGRFRVELEPAGEARADLARGRIDLIVSIDGGYFYAFDPMRIEGRLARSLADEALRGRPGGAPAVTDAAVQEPGSRYIDFLIPGLIGMNIMGGGLWGVGFVIVDMRVRKLLKRYVAAPMRRSDFLLSFAGGRMLFLIPEILVLLLLGSLAFGVPIKGSAAGVAIVSLASAVCFSGMGLLVASRAKKIEVVSGLLNLVMLPMWIFSGVFFSADRFPDVLQPAIHALPLTATNDALRAIMLEGRPLATQASELLILAAWGLASFVVSLRIFRWS